MHDMENRIIIKANTEDPTQKMQDVLANLSPDVETIIEFEKGTYYFRRKGSAQHRIFASSAPSGVNHVIFPILNQKNLTIDGNGSDFVFCDRVQPFLVCNSENITFRNFQTDFSFLRYAYGTIKEIGAEGFSIEIDRSKFDYVVSDGNLTFVCGEDRLSTKTRKISMKRLYPEKSRVYFLYASDTQAKINKAAPSVFVHIAEKDGSVFFRYEKKTTHVDFSVGDRICLAYDNDREAQTFFLDNSRNILVQNVCIHRGGGMGFVADVCEDITLDRFKIQLKEGRAEYYTTTADGIFLTNCSGNFTLKNSLIRDTYDDAINIHGFYLAVSQVLSENEAELVHLHPAHEGVMLCKSGDTLRVSQPTDFTDIGEIGIIEVSYDEDRKKIRIKHNGAVTLAPGMLLENAKRMPRVLIESNEFINCPHIRLSSGNMLIRNNTFCLNDCDLYIWDLVHFWAESGATEQVQIIGNRFGNKSRSNIAIGSDRPSSSNRQHQSVIIQNNVFSFERERALSIRSVEKLKERDNIFGDEKE